MQTEDAKLGGLALLAGVETFGGVPLKEKESLLSGVPGVCRLGWLLEREDCLDISQSDEGRFIDSAGMVANISLENFGSPHVQQYHETFDCSGLYTVSHMCTHVAWNQTSQSSQMTPLSVHVTGREQTPRESFTEQGCCSMFREVDWGVCGNMSQMRKAIPTKGARLPRNMVKVIDLHGEEHLGN